MNEKLRAAGYKAAKHLVYGDVKTRAPAMGLADCLGDGDVERARTLFREALADLLVVGLAVGTATELEVELRTALKFRLESEIAEMTP